MVSVGDWDWAKFKCILIKHLKLLQKYGVDNQVLSQFSENALKYLIMRGKLTNKRSRMKQEILFAK